MHDAVASGVASTSSADPSDADHGCSLCKLCSTCHGIAIIDTAMFTAASVLPQFDLIEPDAAPLAASTRPLEKPPRA
jgi:hypothetical protein